MSEKHLVANGAVCKCKFGTTPDKIKVKQTDNYLNENSPSSKAIANSKDIGQPFQANTFGSCKKMNNNPCKPNITQWQGFYEKITLKNGGKVLLEDSKAICAIGGSPCVDITFHGQTASVTQKNTANTNPKVQAILNPIINIQDDEPVKDLAIPLRQNQ